jgi:hypothetical protein
MSMGSVFSLSNLCKNCKHFIKPTGKKVGKCSLFLLLDEQYLDCIRSRKIDYMCGEKGRYYETNPFLSLDPVHHPVHDNSIDHPVHDHSIDHPVHDHSIDHSIHDHSIDHSDYSL